MTEKIPKFGWQGWFYEDFTVGDVYKLPCEQTMTKTDDVCSQTCR